MQKYPCPYDNCDALLDDLKSFTRHARQFHSSERLTYNCTVMKNCASKFTSLKELIIHEVVHMSAKGKPR